MERGLYLLGITIMTIVYISNIFEQLVGRLLVLIHVEKVVLEKYLLILLAVFQMCV